MDGDEFYRCYNSIKFQENKDDPFSVAEVRRKCLALNFFGSIQMQEGNDLTNYLLGKDLKSYSEVVDNMQPGAVNNYAESIMAGLPCNLIDQRKSWKTGLAKVELKDFMQPLACTSDLKGSCNNNILNEKCLKTLRNAFLDKKLTMSATVRNPYEEHRSMASKQNFTSKSVPKMTAPRVEEEVNFEMDVDMDTLDQNDKPKKPIISFRTAREELEIENARKKRNISSARQESSSSSAPIKKTLGTRKGSVFSKFQPPTRTKESNSQQPIHGQSDIAEGEIDERLKNIDPRMVELIKSEIMDCGATVSWDDIAGLELAKTMIQEIVVWPMLRPDIFTGLRRPPKGILLFGPPGTGKTLIGKCIASQSGSTFFSISASSLTSKWIGDGEKMVRALFAVARCHQPAVVFIDEIDSLLTQRSDSEHESSRRLKTEFLVQLDGAGTAEEDRILIIGATNRPQELDEAARRRLVKRLYIPLPDEKARAQIIHNLISKERHNLSDDDVRKIAVLCNGYSGADMKSLCQEASLGPIRSIPPLEIKRINLNEVRPLSASDFQQALLRVKSSVSEGDLDVYVKWDQQYGCGSGFA